MNKKQKAIYKCTKNCYKMFKRVFKRKNIDEINKENKRYIIQRRNKNVFYGFFISNNRIFYRG